MALKEFQAGKAEMARLHAQQAISCHKQHINMQKTAARIEMVAQRCVKRGWDVERCWRSWRAPPLSTLCFTLGALRSVRCFELLTVDARFSVRRAALPAAATPWPLAPPLQRGASRSHEDHYEADERSDSWYGERAGDAGCGQDHANDGEL